MAKESSAIQHAMFCSAPEEVVPSRIFSLGKGSNLTVTHSGPNQAVLAFWGDGIDATAIDATSTVASFVDPFLPNARYPTAAVEALAVVADAPGGVDGDLLQHLSAEFSDYSEPLLHIIVVGDGSYGHLAQLAGVWAALAFPAANVDVFSFGASFKGNGPAAWLFDRLVQLYYLFPYDLEDVSSATHAARSAGYSDAEALPQALWDLNTDDVIANATTLSDITPMAVPGLDETSSSLYLTGSLGELAPSDAAVSPLIQAQGVRTLYRSVLTGGLSTDGEFPSLGETADATQSSAPAGEILYPDTVGSDGAQPCTPLLCRSRELLRAACWMFDPQDNATILSRAPRTFVSSPQTGADAAVAWIESTQTAVLVWDGAVDAEDWLQNARLSQTCAYRPIDIAKEPQTDVLVHEGFYAQFSSVTVAAASSDPSANITAAILSLSGGVTPRRILVTGHSLGSALAPLSAVWLSTVWTNASISVSGTGVPRVGNQPWLDLFRRTVGSVTQFDFYRDLVAGQPQFLGDTYLQFPEVMWIPTKSVAIAAQRPPFAISDLLYSDHRCYTGYLPSLYTTTAITVPGYVVDS